MLFKNSTPKNYPDSFKLLLQRIDMADNTRFAFDSLKLLQKQNIIREPQDSLKLLQKENTKNPREAFKLLQKPDLRGFRDSVFFFRNQRLLYKYLLYGENTIPLCDYGFVLIQLKNGHHRAPSVIVNHKQM